MTVSAQPPTSYPRYQARHSVQRYLRLRPKCSMDYTRPTRCKVLSRLSSRCETLIVPSAYFLGITPELL